MSTGVTYPRGFRASGVAAGLKPSGALDNLVKGAAGQAIQNANLMLGLPEDAGLTERGVWP